MNSLNVFTMETMNKHTKTNNSLEILYRRYYEGRPERLESLQEERENAEVARMIYDLQKEVGLIQKELTERIRTTPSVISRLESADYEGHSFSMLRKIATAMNQKIQIEFVPLAHLSPSRKTKKVQS